MEGDGEELERVRTHGKLVSGSPVDRARDWDGHRLGMRFGYWLAGLFALGIVYLFGYPLICLWLFNAGVYDRSPDIVQSALEMSAFPLFWLMENVDAYDQALTRWFEVFQRRISLPVPDGP